MWVEWTRGKKTMRACVCVCGFIHTATYASMCVSLGRVGGIKSHLVLHGAVVMSRPVFKCRSIDKV